MTTIGSTIMSLLPMGAGYSIFFHDVSPFATCFVAGFASLATALTLLMVPVAYGLLDRAAFVSTFSARFCGQE